MVVSPALLEAAATDPQAAIAIVNTWSHSTHAAKPSHPGPGAWLHGSNLALMRRMQAADPATNLFLTDFRGLQRLSRRARSGRARRAARRRSSSGGSIR